MKNNTIVTIGRQFGSGGREIGRAVANRLDIPFYDRELLAMASEKSGVSKSVLEGVDESAANAFLQSFAITAFTPGSRISLPTEISINDKLFFAEAEVIKSIADKGSCVIVGRCADYVLRERRECVNVYIHANLEWRVKRVAGFFGLSEGEARNTILKTDKKRASYYSYYTDKDWNDMENYDMTIDSTVLGPEGTAKMICGFAQAEDDGGEE